MSGPGLVTDTFPSTLTNVSWTATASTGSSAGAASGTGNISDAPTILAGGHVTYIVTATVSPSASGTLTDTATVAANSADTDPNTANNTATASTTISLVGQGANAIWIAQVYLDLLHRSINSTEQTVWTNLLDGGFSRGEAALMIESSPEFITQEIDTLYLHFLKRAPDPFGLAGFTLLFENGGTLQQAEIIMVGSPEYFQRIGGGTPTGFLNAVFQDALGRTIDPVGMATLGAQLAAGASPSTVAGEVMASQEFAQHLVAVFYQDFLRRTVDPVGMGVLAPLVQTKDATNLTIATLLASPEYFNDVQASNPLSPAVPLDWLS
jgi:hypothetical protein